jgi:hypothetical protein
VTSAYKAENKLEIKIWPDQSHIFVKEMQDAAFYWLDKQFGK